MQYTLKEWRYEGKLVGYLLTCPDCGLSARIDDDQYHGRVSVDCPECPFHKTIDFSQN